MRVRFTRPAADSWSIQVADTGRGIPPEHQADVFEPFHSADTAQQHGGAGLDLSIVKQLVERMGGTIHLENAVGRGSTFTITLPLAAGADETGSG